MLEELRISCLGVIDDAVLEFAPGLTVVTGETGAGKTMVVSGLALLLGGRADAARVRSGSARAVVEGRIAVPRGGGVAAIAEDAGAELDDGSLILTRTINADGRSRAHLGGRSVPAGLLADLSAELVALHGQHDQQRLLSPVRQREALDRYAGEAVGVPLAAYQAAYRRHREVLAELTRLIDEARERAQEAELLRFGLREVTAAEPQPGEDAELAAEIARLGHAEALRSAAEAAHTLLASDDSRDESPDATTLVAAARTALERQRDHDAALGDLADRLAEAGYLLADVAAELASYSAGLEADPLRLAAAQERQAVLTSLTRRYGDDLDGVLAWAKQAEARLTELDGDDETIARLAAERDQLVATLGTLAAELTSARTKAAAELSKAVTLELKDLAMPHAEVVAAVGSRTDFGPDGLDEVELQLASNPGSPPRPLAKGASGGELSRVMLAVEVVFAGADPVPTFIFDEVDAGVGGKAAVEVGRRLARLARSAQVIVVTHLPQVAAFADLHLLVEKSDDGLVTRSGVTALDEAGQVQELSRMLAGLEESAHAQAHANELLEAARTFKAAMS
jgi:DNA repair protein RecN (Recombination protein N)